MKKTLLILAFALGLIQITQAQNSYPIDGKWTYEASLNTMYIFENASICSGFFFYSGEIQSQDFQI